MVRRSVIRLAFCLVLVGMLVSGNVAIGHQAPEFVEVHIGFKNAPDVTYLRSLGIDVQHEYKYMPVVLATVPTYAMAALGNNPNIAYVEPNYEVTVLQTVPWGISRIGAITVHQELGITGTGVKVAILDTGIDGNHRDLNVYGGASFISGTTWHDDHGHGTHVAGTVAALDNTVDVIGVAPDARLYAVKVLNSAGSGTYAGIAQGIEWSISNGIDVINMSLGGSSSDNTLQQACQNAWNAGIVIVASAGNSGNTGGTGDNIGYPAKYSTVIAVGATTSSDVRASWSSTGPALEIMAPGASILSTRQNGGTTTMSGTSMAAPHVAGVAALIMQAHPGWSNQQIRDRMNNTADPIGDGDPYKYGNGLVNAVAAVGTGTTPSYTVTVSASPTEGGTVTGGGTYESGSTATVSANANSGWQFVNWTENGNVVSQSASYTFTVTGNRNLVANFQSDTAPPDGVVSVTAIQYSTSGGRFQDRHLHVTVFVASEGSPVAGAAVTGALLLNGNQVSTLSGTTASNGTVLFSYNNAPSGYYTVTVLNVTADGLTWDGITPENGFSK